MSTQILSLRLKPSSAPYPTHKSQRYPPHQRDTPSEDCWLPYRTRTEPEQHFILHSQSHADVGVILCMHQANERRCYNVTSSLIGCVHTQNYPCDGLVTEGTAVSAMLVTYCSWNIPFLIPQRLKKHHGISSNNVYPQLKLQPVVSWPLRVYINYLRLIQIPWYVTILNGVGGNVSFFFFHCGWHHRQRGNHQGVRSQHWMEQYLTSLKNTGLFSAQYEQNYIWGLAILAGSLFCVNDILVIYG